VYKTIRGDFRRFSHCTILLSAALRSVGEWVARASVRACVRDECYRGRARNGGAVSVTENGGKKNKGDLLLFCRVLTLLTVRRADRAVRRLSTLSCNVLRMLRLCVSALRASAANRFQGPMTGLVDYIHRHWRSDDKKEANRQSCSPRLLSVRFCAHCPVGKTRRAKSIIMFVATTKPHYVFLYSVLECIAISCHNVRSLCCV